MYKKHNQLIALNLIDKIQEIEVNPPRITGFSISRLLYLIHLIISHKQKKHVGSYSLLNMAFMHNVIPKANEYLTFLKKQGIIEWIEYCSGRNSRMYRLVNEGRVEFRAISDKKLIYRIERNRRNIKRKNSKKYPLLNKYIKVVQIDYDAALRTIELKYQENIKISNPKAEGRRTFSLAEINKIQSGDIYIKCNKTNGRLDSNFTRLPLELLKHLSINVILLIEDDIKNSQLFFAACLTNLTPEIENLLNVFLGHSLTMSVKSLQISDCEDVKLYVYLVTSGSLYEPYLMSKFIENGIYVKNRDDLKSKLFKALFGKKNAFKYNKIARLFKSLFPNVHKLFDVIKRDEHNMLAIILQRIESYTILERVVPNIIKELPDLAFITRHDSILQTRLLVASNCDKVKEIMLSTIKEVTGLTPKVENKSEDLKDFKYLPEKQKPEADINQSNIQPYKTYYTSMLAKPL